MKRFMKVLAAVLLAAVCVGQAVAQTPARVRVDASSVTGVAAGGAEAARRAEAGVAELRHQLVDASAALAVAQADVLVAKRIGGEALDRAKKMQAKLAAKVAELEGKLASEATKAQAEVDKAAVNATVKIVRIQHGMPEPTVAPASDAVTALASDSPAGSPSLATGLERFECPAGTAPSVSQISVTDGRMRAGFKSDKKCVPIPGYISPDAPKAGHSTGDYLVACGIGAGSTALVALAIPGVSNFSSDVEVSGADYGVAAAAGAGVGCLGGVLFTALSD